MYIGDVVKIKATPKSKSSIPYAGYEGVIVGYHEGRYWGDGMWDDEEFLITIKLENGTPKGIRIDVEDVEAST